MVIYILKIWSYILILVHQIAGNSGNFLTNLFINIKSIR